jgi:hypothetical protein
MRMVSTLTPVMLDQYMLWVVLYIGPDVMLPLTSALAAIAGVLLMFWQRCVGLLRSVRNALFQRNKAPRA